MGAVLLMLSGSSMVGVTQGKVELERNTFGYVSSQPRADDFNTWQQTGENQAQTTAYISYLSQQGVGEVLPLPELLSAARDWQKCGVTPFVLPPPDKWQNMVSTLKLLRQLQAQNLLPAFAVTSSYRYPALNTCAGGSAKSKHLSNGALDMRFNSPADEQKVFPALCQYWRQHGAQQAMGLGFYAGGQIHIDTQGFRTWGQDYSAKSSPCQR